MFESREAVREAEMSTTVSAPAPGSKDDGSTTMSKAPDQPLVEASVASEDEDRLPTFREIVDLIIHPVVLRSFAIVLVATVILVGLPCTLAQGTGRQGVLVAAARFGHLGTGRDPFVARADRPNWWLFRRYRDQATLDPGCALRDAHYVSG
ncbi:MAG: hypothetical protein EBV53_05160 [Proteobacteria bacterium]|nr:hypothetical protein [Pseudomonadota bacterium]